jgi:hypothetical protein
MECCGDPFRCNKHAFSRHNSVMSAAPPLKMI